MQVLRPLKGLGTRPVPVKGQNVSILTVGFKGCLRMQAPRPVKGPGNQGPWA